MLANRVVIGTGLRSKYGAQTTFTARFDRFRNEEVFSGKQLSSKARDILQHIPEGLKQVSEKEVTNELVGFVHALSKPMHFLSPSLREGLYIGGDPVVMTATTILVALLQENDHIPGEVQVVNYTGKTVFSLVGGAVTRKDI